MIHKVLVLLLVFSIVLSGCMKIDFDGSQTTNENEFLLQVKTLNRDVSSSLELMADESISVDISVSRGMFMVQIIDPNGVEIYSGNIEEDFEFIMPVEVEGEYMFKVDGKDAAGVVHFIKQSS